METRPPAEADEIVVRDAATEWRWPWFAPALGAAVVGPFIVVAVARGAVPAVAIIMLGGLPVMLFASLFRWRVDRAALRVTHDGFPLATSPDPRFVPRASIRRAAVAPDEHGATLALDLAHERALIRLPGPRDAAPATAAEGCARASTREALERAAGDALDAAAARMTAAPSSPVMNAVITGDERVTAAGRPQMGSTAGGVDPKRRA